MKTASGLALHGGKPVRPTLLPYGHQSVSEEDVHAVVEVLHSDWLTTGPKTDEFEAAFAKYVESKYAVSFSSGTAALHGASFAAGFGVNDEVITTPMTFCATTNSVLYQGAKPIFADVCNDTLNIDPVEVAKRITDRTKALIAVDYAGHPAELDELLELADGHDLTLIEDASHALGAEYRSRRVGAISHMSVFSFHPVKHITTGEGGMVTTDDEDFARRLRLFRNHGIDRDAKQRQAKGDWYYEMVVLGYNYRLSDILCSLGLSQLQRLHLVVKRRREIAERYTNAFKNQPGLFPPSVRPDVKPSWHLYPIRLDLARLSAGRRDVFRALRAEGIGVNVHYIPVHFHPYYRKRFGYLPGQYPIAETAYEQLITLPLFPGMSDQDVEDVIEAVTKVIGYYAP